MLFGILSAFERFLFFLLFFLMFGVEGSRDLAVVCPGEQIACTFLCFGSRKCFDSRNYTINSKYFAPQTLVTLPRTAETGTLKRTSDTLVTVSRNFGTRFLINIVLTRDTNAWPMHYSARPSHPGSAPKHASCFSYRVIVIIHSSIFGGGSRNSRCALHLQLVLCRLI